jgi:WD40 repeat protein
VANWVNEAQRKFYPGAPAVTKQRLSDWRKNIRVPQRFESIEFTIRVLIVRAKKKGTPPEIPGLYDLRQWKKWWREARTATDDAADRTPQKANAPSPACPYKGLAPFQTADQDRFFGRTRAVNELTALIIRAQSTDPGIVLLTGPSGAGKSSLLSAGLSPAASSGALGDEGWVPAYMTPGGDPMAELARCLEQPGIKERAEGVRLLIIIDQAEQLFTPKVSAEARAEFLGELHTMSQPSTSTSGAVVVMGLRADALGRCVELPELAAAVQSRCMVLRPMSKAELRDVVTKPAKMAGLSIEPGLVDLILHDVATEKNSVHTIGRLPLLSHALTGTWQQRKNNKLTAAGYKTAGGLRGSVETTGEKAWSQLNEEQRGIARQMLLRLITISEDGYDSCRRELKHELLARLPDAENAADVLETLIAARLLTIHDSDVMFTHEIVLRAWVRLAGWIEDDRAHAPIRQRAKTDADAWIEKGCHSSYLQTGAKLEATLALLTDNQEVDQSVTQFAEASRRHQRRATKTKRGAIVAVSVLAVICALAAGVAFWQRNTISRQRNTAVFNQILAAADARQLNDPSLSAQLTMVAHRLRPNDQTRSRLLAIQNTPLATSLTDHRGIVRRVAFSPDGNLLASASWDNTVRLWNTSDPNNPQPVGQPLRGHTGFVTAVAFSPDGKTLASSGADNSVRLWDLAIPTDIKELTALSTGGKGVYLMAFSADGRTLAAPSDDRTIRLWDVTNRRAPHAGAVLSGHTGSLRAIVFSPNGHTLASASNDRTVRLWNVTDPTHPQQAGPPLTGFTDTALAVAFDPAGSVLAVSGLDGVIQLWNVADPACPVRAADPLSAHIGASWSVAFSPDGTILASSSDDGNAKLWNLLDPAHPVALGQPLADASGGLTSVTFHPSGRYLATGSTSGAISLWTLPTGVIPNHFGRIDSPAFSTDGTVMVTASDNVAQLWTSASRLTRAATLRLSGSPEGGGFGYTVRVDPSGRILATASLSVPTVLWDISDITKPMELSTLPNTTKYAGIVAFSPDGRTVATAGDDSTVQLWDITEPARPQRLSEPLTGYAGYLIAVTFSPDGRTVVASSVDNTVRAWDITDRDHPIPAAAAITGHAGPVGSVSISPNGETLATGGRDQTIRLWDITDPLHAKLIGSPLHSHSSMAQIAFSPDGKTLAVGSDDGSVLLWDITDRDHPAPIGDSLIPPGIASRTRVAFDPHGRLYAASRDGTIRIFDLDTDNTKRICASTRNVLTEQRWNQILPSLPYDPPCQRAAQ